MASRCTLCGLRDFEAEDGRCPQCLRRGGLIAADAPLPRRAGSWGRFFVLALITALLLAVGGYAVWNLAEREAAVDWPKARGVVTKEFERRVSCEVDFAFTVAGQRFEGRETFFGCPRDGLEISYDPADPSRHQTVSGFAIFLMIFGAGFGLLGGGSFIGLLLSMLFPHNERLRRFSAMMGSLDARAAERAELASK